MEEFKELELQKHFHHKEDKILISVILPIYNMSDYLPESLNSIIEQNFKDIEIICVNDGSTDNSLDILYEYAKLDKRIMVINQQNQGAGLARNAGILIAKGKYIFFLDPDDLLYNKEVFEKLYDFAAKNNTDICGGNVQMFGNIAEGIDEKLRVRFLQRSEKFHRNLQNFDSKEIIGANDYHSCFYFWRFLYKKEFLLQNQLLFKDFRRFEDPLFLMEVLSKKPIIGTINDIVYFYRINHKAERYTMELYTNSMKAISECIKVAIFNDLYIHIESVVFEFLTRSSLYKKFLKGAEEEIKIQYIIKNTLNQLESYLHKKVNYITVNNLFVIIKIKSDLESLDFIDTAILYGSSVKSRLSRDIDIAIIFKDNDGIIPAHQYKLLYDLRNRISKETGFDIDLVPHTNDELTDTISPLYNPRYNPAISKGILLKGNSLISEIKEETFKMSDIARYVLLDNRTITRRQLVRSLKREEFDIFLSKLGHTPGNILTYRAILNGVPYFSNPSDLDESARILDSQNGDHFCKTFVKKIKKLKSIVKNKEIPYNESLMFFKACEIMNDFEFIISREFYIKIIPKENHAKQDRVLLSGQLSQITRE